MNGFNYSSLGFSVAVLLAIGAFAPLPAQAAGVYNVKTYHATGNGITDDTFYILQAAKAASLDPGSTLLFPKGNYIFSGQLLNANSFDVVGEDATLTTLDGGLRLNGSKVHVHGMNFVTRNSSGPTGILVIDVNGFEIRDCTFASGFATVISVTGSSNGKINANQMAVSATSSAGVGLGQSESITVHSNVITGSGGSTANAFQSSNSSNLTFSSNMIRDVPSGAVSSNDLSLSYSGNLLASCTKLGISLSTDRSVTISSNRILSTGGAAVQLSNVDSVTIGNNIVQGCQTGVSLQGSSGSVSITGNTIGASDIYGVSGGKASVLVVNGNKFSGVASAVNINNISVFLSIQNNNVADCFFGAFNVSSCTASTKIVNNTIRNCGLHVSNPSAVIYVNSPGTAGTGIKTNTYSGSTTNLQYFIWCVQSGQDISGNHTNTGLPNRIGS